VFESQLYEFDDRRPVEHQQHAGRPRAGPPRRLLFRDVRGDDHQASSGRHIVYDTRSARRRQKFMGAPRQSCNAALCMPSRRGVTELLCCCVRPSAVYISLVCQVRPRHFLAKPFDLTEMLDSVEELTAV
jgi:hypothetical protein